MASGGDYNEFHKNYGNKNTQHQLLAGDSTTVQLMAPRSEHHYLFIQSIYVSVTTYSNKTLTFQDGAGTPVPIAIVTVPSTAPSAAGEQLYHIDFGPRGVRLTKGKVLNMVISGAGAAAIITIDAYERILDSVPVTAGV
jgi:hypothetical protein